MVHGVDTCVLDGDGLIYLSVDPGLLNRKLDLLQAAVIGVMLEYSTDDENRFH